jgi:hypothetical protein
VAYARSKRLDLDQEGIIIAVGRNLAHDKPVAGAFAFHPELVARAAVERHEAGLARLAEGFVIHEAEHEDALRRGVLNDGGDEAVELTVIETHSFFVKNRVPAGTKKPASTAAGILSFSFYKFGLSQDAPRSGRMMVMMQPGGVDR